MSDMVTKSFSFEGKRYYVRAKTEEEAIAKVALKKHDLEQGVNRVSQNMLVSAWAEEWLGYTVRHFLPIV